MTFEEFWLAAAEYDEFMEVLMQMANHSEKAKREKETFEIDSEDIKDWLKKIIKEAIQEALYEIVIIQR